MKYKKGKYDIVATVTTFGIIPHNIKLGWNKNKGTVINITYKALVGFNHQGPAPIQRGILDEQSFMDFLQRKIDDGFLLGIKKIQRA